jgi:hypothetical protein
VCEDCAHEFPEECMSYIVQGVCALCAIVRIAKIDAERALDFQALSSEWFAAKYEALDALDDATQKEADALHAFDVRDAMFSAEHPYESRVAS